MISLTAALMLAFAQGGPAQPPIVIVREASAVAGCQPLGEVRASSLMGGLLASAAYNKVLDQLKAKAAALGGTHVQIIDVASGYSGARGIGGAFKCVTPAAPDAAPQAPR